MDRPVLHSLVERLRAEDRLRAFAAALPARARVAEPALPLLLAALHEELGRGLVVLLPEDADARDTAEAAAWFLGEAHVGLFPSRGVHWSSGLEPPPHLVGERARALDVLAAGGLVCASAIALAEPTAPPELRPAPIAVATGAEPGLEGLAESLALAGREPLRIELFGDEIEQIRAFSPFTQRALRRVEEATIYAAAERSREHVEHALEPQVPDDLVLPFNRSPDLVWEPDDVRQVWREEGLAELSLAGAALLEALPQGQPFAFEAQRPALAARGLAEAENELGNLLRQGLEVIVTFAHRGEADRRQQLLRRVEVGGALQFVVSPARRGFVWRDLGLALLPDTQVFRRRAPRATAPLGRTLQSFADLRTGDYVV